MNYSASKHLKFSIAFNPISFSSIFQIQLKTIDSALLYISKGVLRMIEILESFPKSTVKDRI